MIKIAHRGNTHGAKPELENRPEYLLDAITNGFQVEVDVWWHENSIYFGHDFPQYYVSPEQFVAIKNDAWFHCKTFDTLYHFLINHDEELNFFWHQTDQFALTNNNAMWTYPGNPVSDLSILVDLDLTSGAPYDILYGICSDNVALL